jgi:hypothetical protein
LSAPTVDIVPPPHTILPLDDGPCSPETRLNSQLDVGAVRGVVIVVVIGAVYLAVAGLRLLR